MRSHLLSGASLLAILVCANDASATPITYNYDGSTIQEFTVPVTGTYDITAAGAQGGAGDFYSGGRGATVGGDVSLTAGAVLDIVVGGQGGIGFGGGGGGGSFVFYMSAPLPLVVAGGGGGGAHYSSGGPGQAGKAGQAGYGGVPLHPSGAGGTGGSGGSGASYGGGGGAGWSSDGGASIGCPALTAKGGYGPPSFSGGAGATGAFGYSAPSGGFGGGGGVACDAGGGGGGFSGGGGGGGFSGGYGGGGGGSYLAPNFTEIVMTAGDNGGNGYVTINPVSSPPPSVFEPGTLGLLTTGLAGLGLIRRRRRLR